LSYQERNLVSKFGFKLTTRTSTPSDRKFQAIGEGGDEFVAEIVARLHTS
jgi:hypothetical protein